MKVLVFILFLISGISFSQTEVRVPIRNSIPTDGNKNISAVSVLYDSVSNKYYYGTDLITTGFYGSVLITSTITATGNFYSIQVLEDCVIDSLVDLGRSGDNINGLALSTGTVIFGKDITRIKLQSGKVIAYKRK